MEIKGRECEEVKIGKHVYYFVSKFKGKEYKAIQNMVYGQMDLKSEKSADNMGVFLANIPKLFELLCLQINDGSIVANEDFLDNLDMDEYGKVQDKIVSKVTDFFAQIK